MGDDLKGNDLDNTWGLSLTIGSFSQNKILNILMAELRHHTVDRYIAIQ